METFKNKNGRPILLCMVTAIQNNKGHLGEVDGLIGDGDHGMNMNKGFTVFADRFLGGDIRFTDGLDELGSVLLNEIGGSMGPIYGSVFMDMAEAGDAYEEIGLDEFTAMMQAGIDSLYDIVDARQGDKTLVDTLQPAVDALKEGLAGGLAFSDALNNTESAAQKGRDATKDMVAKFGRSSRLGERSRGVLDAGAVSCCILLMAMSEGIKAQLKEQ